MPIYICITFFLSNYKEEYELKSNKLRKYSFSYNYFLLCLMCFIYLFRQKKITRRYNSIHNTTSKF